MWIRTGTCNMCGECCGYPRITDGGQNNAWPNDWPESIETWEEDYKEEKCPVFKITGHLKKKGTITINKNSLKWVWIQGQGLCKDTGKGTWDQRCPFLSKKLSDGTVPCLLYGTSKHEVWQKYCNEVPPEKFDTKAQVDNWFKNCPSCSFIYEEIDK